MLYFVLVFMIEVCFLGILNAFSFINDAEFASWIFVIINIFFIAVYLFVLKPTKYNVLFFIALLLRVVALIVNFYILRLTESDSEYFHQVALQNQHSTDKLVYTNYSIFLTAVYYLTDSSRIIAQYISVLMSLGYIIIMKNILELLKVSQNIVFLILYILSFQVVSIFFSSGLGRESWISLFLILSIFYFVKWFIYGGRKYIILVIVCVLLSASMHSGVLFILWGYVLAFLSYLPHESKVKINISTIFNIVLLLGILSFIFPYSGFFTSKFQNIDVEDALINSVNIANTGCSNYLSWMSADTIWEVVLFAPLTIFYFLFSPIPFDWRNILDVGVFCLDSSIYIFLFYCSLKNYKNMQSPRLILLVRYFFISILFCVFVFSFGTKNSGTAMRHRLKILPFIVVVYAVSLENGLVNKMRYKF